MFFQTFQRLRTGGLLAAVREQLQERGRRVAISVLDQRLGGQSNGPGVVGVGLVVDGVKGRDEIERVRLSSRDIETLLTRYSHISAFWRVDSSATFVARQLE